MVHRYHYNFRRTSPVSNRSFTLLLTVTLYAPSTTSPTSEDGPRSSAVDFLTKLDSSTYAARTPRPTPDLDRERMLVSVLVDGDG
ncbi:hypothetical protein DU500_15835 [Haloplanus rubicundus]|uniref:Uncharacterized protein n=1 Tax=Haloplanus rubicundus TaxID=1547898 RepID=A0A345E6F7_9EURY|nr:hypothetical protein DU500_15835 [Haloplanus rubicundus]